MLNFALANRLGAYNTLNGSGFLTAAINILSTRFASKKAGGSTRNKKGRCRPKHRAIHFQDGEFVHPNTMLVTQNRLRCHPGLNVGFGRNGTLFAMCTGRVMVTCEKIDPKLEHTWVSKAYAGKNVAQIYKKYFHVIPEKEHCRFKLIDSKETSPKF